MIMNDNAQRANDWVVYFLVARNSNCQITIQWNLFAVNIAQLVKDYQILIHNQCLQWQNNIQIKKKHQNQQMKKIYKKIVYIFAIVIGKQKDQALLNMD